MQNKPYDLKHADVGIELQWDAEKNRLVVFGAGRCELGEVNCSLVAYSEFSLEVTAGDIDGSVNCGDSACLKAGRISGDICITGAAHVACTFVGGDIEATDCGSLEAEVIQGDVSAWNGASICAGQIGGNYEANDGAEILLHEKPLDELKNELVEHTEAIRRLVNASLPGEKDSLDSSGTMSILKFLESLETAINELG